VILPFIIVSSFWKGYLECVDCRKNTSPKPSR
jgi:hypothetical protein